MKSGLDRVRFTLEKYPVKDAYFIDVLAGGYNGGRKYDFNPESPAGAQKNLEGKLMIIKELNRNGLDVATEDFTGFFVGHVWTDKKKIRAFKIGAGGSRTTVEFRVSDGNLEFNAEPKTPYKVVYQ